MIIIISVGVVVFIGIVLYLSANSKPKIQNNSELEDARLYYETALKGTDRKAALMAGRFYYSLRHPKRILTMQDELTIANDLSTMPVETFRSENVSWQ